MANLDENLQRILDSPESMAKIAELARSMMGDENANSVGEDASTPLSGIPGFPDLDPALMRLVSAYLMRTRGGSILVVSSGWIWSSMVM